VRAAKPQQHQHHTTVLAAVAWSPRIQAVALACSSEQTLCLQWQDELFPFKIQTAAAAVL